jgi:hypothetical protein
LIYVAIVDHPDSGCADDLGKIAAALTRQCHEHFAPVYGVDATVSTFSTLMPGAWTIGLFSDPDQPGVLGYHDLAPNGLPFAKVFPKLDAQDGAALSTTISHELLEMLADAWCIASFQGKDGNFWANEPCDAVEQDAYDIDGVKVSNFVTPNWYGTGGACDYMGLCHQYEVRPGGYAQHFVPGTGWQQTQHGQVAPRSYRIEMQRRGIGRTSRRAA